MTSASSVSQGSSFSMEFPIDVDALFTFETICEESIGALTRADGDVARASAIVSQQESLLVPVQRGSADNIANIRGDGGGFEGVEAGCLGPGVVDAVGAG